MYISYDKNTIIWLNVAQKSMVEAVMLFTPGHNLSFMLNELQVNILELLTLT